MSAYKAIDKCLACGGEILLPSMDLPGGLEPYWVAEDQPLANAFHDGATNQPRYPLALNVCQNCHHSQLTVAVDPEKMFSDYPYVSGTSETLREYFRWFVGKVEKDQRNKPLHVLDIGCNDGSLLKSFSEKGHAIFGVDPAGLCDFDPVYHGMWSTNAISELKISSIDVIVAMNVLGHVSDPFGFLALCKLVLAPGGRIYIQTSQRNMIDRCEFDTVYHEHISYFEPSSFLALAHRAGLRMVKLSEVDVHGGSWLVELDAAPVNPKIFPNDFEYWKSVRTMADYRAFSDRAEQIKRDFVTSLVHARENGFDIVGYGAAAKANTFLNFCDSRLDYILDENPLKIGKMTPGLNIPVCVPSIVSSHPGRIMFVITAWNFREEIERKIRQLRPGFRDAFMTYYPTLEIWE